MGLRGDLDSISLADIFQTLSMTGQEGTLYVRQATTTKYIFFAPDGVTMLTSGEKKKRLGDLLVGLGKISTEDLKDALFQQKQSGALLGETLIQMGLVTEQDIENAVRFQIEEEIYDLFAWDNASFEFKEGARPEDVSDEVDSTVTSLRFNVNSLIMEAARRADEWELIEQAIPTTKAIFKLEAAALRGEYTDQEVLILEAIDGDRNVDEVVGQTHVPRFDVCKFITRLHQASLAKRAPVSHLLLRGDAYRDAGDLEGALKFYTQAADGKLKKRSEQLDVRRRLAEALEARGDKKEAGEQYKILADLQAEDHDVEGAINYWQKVIDLNPLDLENKERLISVYLENRTHLDPDRSDVIRGIEYSLFKNGKALAMAFSYAGQVGKAKEVLQRLIDITPSNIELRKALVNIHLEHDEKAEAVDELDRIASYLVTARQFEEVKAVYRNMLKAAPDRDDIKRKLALLDREERAESAAAQPKKKSRAWVLLLILVLAGGGAYGWWAYIKVPQDAAPLLAEAERLAGKVADAPEGTPWQRYKPDFEEAVRLFRKVAATYEFTPTSGAAEARAKEVEALFEKRKATFSDNEDVVAKAARGQRDLIGERLGRHNWEDGALLEDIADAISKYQGNAKAAGVVATLEGWRDQISELGTRIDGRLGEAAQLVEQGKLQDAWRIYRELRGSTELDLKRRLPGKWAAIAFPYEIRTQPPGASVSVDGVPQAGVSPTQPLWHQLGKRLLIDVAKRGYESDSRGYVVGENDAGPTVEFSLKLATWYEKPLSIDTPHNLGTPLVATANGEILAATDNGFVLALSPAPQQLQKAGPDLQVGKTGNPQKNSPTGAPAVQGELCVVSRNDGVVLFFARNEPTPKHQYRLYDHATDDARYLSEEPVGSPVIDRERSLVFVTSTLGRIHAISLSQGERAYANAPFAERALRLTPPVLSEGYVIAGTEDGWLTGISAEPSEQERGQYAFRFHVSPDARFIHAPAASPRGGLITVASSRGEQSTLYAFSLTKERADRATLSRAWQQNFELRGTPVGSPLMILDPVKAVVVAVRDARGMNGRVIALTLLGGDLLWGGRPDGIQTQPQLQQPAIWRDRLYVLASGRLTAHDVSTGALAHTLSLSDDALPRFGPVVTPDGHVIAVLRKGPSNLLFTAKE